MVDLKIQIPNDFYAEEEKSGFLISTERKKMWAVELDLLNEFNRVCKKYDLHFFADSGTLLGAIRDGGFIPWDDDIDVVMSRTDYNKLLEISNKEFKNPYFFQSAYSDDGYLKGHAQLRNSNTAAILPGEGAKVPYNQGIFLDIFPIDRTSRFAIVNKLKCKRLSLYRSVFSYVYNDNPPKGIKYKFISFVTSIMRSKGLKNEFARFEAKCQKIIFPGETVDKVSYYWKYEKYKNLHSKWFNDVIYVPFEFMEIPVPKQYDRILTMYYGSNYMIPKTLKAGHQAGGNLIVDTDNSYIDIINQEGDKLK